MVLYQRNRGTLLVEIIALYIWDIYCNSAQYFNTFPSVEEFGAEPQRNISTSKLEMRRGLLTMNIHSITRNFSFFTGYRLNSGGCGGGGRGVGNENMGGRFGNGSGGDRGGDGGSDRGNGDGGVCNCYQNGNQNN